MAKRRLRDVFGCTSPQSYAYLVSYLTLYKMNYITHF